jgi:hypothetical protein
VRIEKILCTVLHKVNDRQVEKAMETHSKAPEGSYKTSPDESVRWSIDAIVGSMTFSRTCPRRRMSHYDGDQDPLLPPAT